MPTAKIIEIPGWLTTRQAAELLSEITGAEISFKYMSQLAVYGRVAVSARFSGMRLFKEVDIREYARTHPRLGENIKAREAAEATG